MPPANMAYKATGRATIGTKNTIAPEPIINPHNIARLVFVFIFDNFLFLRNFSSSFRVSNLLLASKSMMLMASISVVKY
jgi:hypothetical protein